MNRRRRDPVVAPASRRPLPGPRRPCHAPFVVDEEVNEDDTSMEDDFEQATAKARSIRNVLIGIMVGLAVLQRMGVIDVPTWIFIAIALVASLLPMVALAKAMATQMPPDTRG